jgi:DnaJ-class molecular chaperone
MTTAPKPRQCARCDGAGGRTVNTSSGGVTRQSWVRCEPCYGTGAQGGGR